MASSKVIIRNVFMIETFILGLVLLIIGCVLGFAVFPSMVDTTIDHNVRLEFGTKQYARFEELPFPLTFKVYMFNITNVNGINKGDKPIVQEVGPYVYKQYRTKKNIIYDYVDNSIEYEQHLHFEFDQEASFPLTEEDVLTVVNVPKIAIEQEIVETTLNSGFPQFIEYIDEALKLLFPDENGAFWDVKVRDFLFGGIKFCNYGYLNAVGGYPGLLGITVCDYIKDKKLKNMEIINNGIERHHLFSFMKYKETAFDGVYRVNNGMETVDDVGRIMKWEGDEYTTFWGYGNSTCEKVQGWDSTIFPPHIDEDSQFDIFVTDICRTSKLLYASEMEYEGIRGLRYEMHKNDFASANTLSSNECFCANVTVGLQGKGCLPDGFLDLGLCLGAPVVASFPHMLWGDQSYQDSVLGLYSNEQIHTSFVELEPKTGTPLRGAKMAQFNMILRKIDEIEGTSMFATPSVVPILWVSEGMELPQSLVQELNESLFDVLTTLDIVTWVLIGLGIFLIVVSVGCYLYFQMKTEKYDSFL